MITMNINLLRNTYAATAAMVITLFAQPTTIKAQTSYNFQIADTKVTSENYKDLSKIAGVSGNITYEPETKTLTLENATIETNEFPGMITNATMKIVLIGNNTIISKQRSGLTNQYSGDITISGKGGTLSVKGADESDGLDAMIGIGNWGRITIKECTVEAVGGAAGLYSGLWKFENCTVRAKGNGDEGDEHFGSICWLWDEEPYLIDCYVASPTSTEWKEYKEGNYTYYSLYGADKKVVTGWVTITSGDPAGIDNITTTNTATNGIYNIGGMRLSKEIKDLPKGLYIVNGKKVVKK